jgi:hypothetical protein
MSEVDPNSDEYKKAIELANDLGLSKDDANARLEVARRSIREGYLSQLRSSERGLYDFDVSLAIHPHAGRLYIIPYCDMLMRDVLDFLRKDKRVTDFAYWDNTDQPDNVSPRAWKEWKERGRIWEAINNNWQDMLCLDILNKSRFFALDPGLQLSQELAKAKT